ncbi:hypothetical protein QQG55_31310 [Brugia pahangi]
MPSPSLVVCSNIITSKMGSNKKRCHIYSIHKLWSSIPIERFPEYRIYNILKLIHIFKLFPLVLLCMIRHCE